MPLIREVGLSPTDIVLDGDPALLFPKRENSPQSSAHVYCGQTAAWIKMPLGMKIGLGPGHIVLDGGPAPPPPKDGTWFGGIPRPSDVVLHGDPAPPKRCTAPSFRPMTIVAKRLDG